MWSEILAIYQDRHCPEERAAFRALLVVIIALLVESAPLAAWFYFHVRSLFLLGFVRSRYFRSFWDLSAPRKIQGNKKI